MINVDQLTMPAVRTAVTAINNGDRGAFLATLTPEATLSDDGNEQDLTDWADREIFTVNGYMEIESESGGGQYLIARYRNDTWGQMRTSWAFTISGGKISRIEAGQA